MLAYLDREHEGWSEEHEHPGMQPSNSDMNSAQALAILGLNDNASKDEIIAAHRKMIQKMHPDRGGSTYLAAKINAAKEFLLKS